MSTSARRALHTENQQQHARPSSLGHSSCWKSCLRWRASYVTVLRPTSNAAALRGLCRVARGMRRTCQEPLPPQAIHSPLIHSSATTTNTGNATTTNTQHCYHCKHRQDNNTQQRHNHDNTRRKAHTYCSSCVLMVRPCTSHAARKSTMSSATESTKSITRFFAIPSTTRRTPHPGSLNKIHNR